MPPNEKEPATAVAWQTNADCGRVFLARQCLSFAIGVPTAVGRQSQAGDYSYSQFMSRKSPCRACEAR